MPRLDWRGRAVKVVVAESAESAARLVADLVERYITAAPRPALGLATGETMEAVFAELVRRHREQGLSFARVHAYLLDEYLDLGRDDPCAYRNVVHRLLTGRINMESDTVHGPNAQAIDATAECARYEMQVRAASIGLQLLGIGTNGHIAFNEPGCPLDSTTRVVELSEQTRADNARFFPANRSVPASAISQGIATIGAAAQLVLVACGKRKARAAAQAIEGPNTAGVPASAIQDHPSVTVVLDEPAASCLSSTPTWRQVHSVTMGPSHELAKGLTHSAQ